VKYLLDTDHISIWQTKKGRDYLRLRARLDSHDLDDIACCIVSLHEQLIGCHSAIIRARHAKDVANGYRLLEGLYRHYTQSRLLPYDDRAIVAFDTLAAAKTRGSTMDLRIASIAIANNLILVTRNTVDFSKVPGLVLEDWTI
jgi:tRNA(fMet)-specific endonuclease VapC